MDDSDPTHLAWPPSSATWDKFAKFASASLTVLFVVFGWQFSYDHSTSQDDVFYGTPQGFSEVAFVLALLFLVAAVLAWRIAPTESPRRDRIMRRICGACIAGTALAIPCLFWVVSLFQVFPHP